MGDPSEKGRECGSYGTLCAARGIVNPRTRHQRCESLHEFQRRHDDVARAVAIRRLQLEHDLSGVVHTEPLVGDGRGKGYSGRTPLVILCLVLYIKTAAQTARPFLLAPRAGLEPATCGLQR